MPFETPPHESTARSASTHSTTVFGEDRGAVAGIEAERRAGRRRSRGRPAPVCAHVHSRQRPSFFSRIRTRADRAATPFQNSAGIVSPARTMSLPRHSRRACRASRERFAAPHRQVFFRFQRRSPRAPASFMPEVELLDVVLLAQPLAGVFHDDAAVLQHVAVVGDVERHVRVLLDQEQRRAALAVDADDDLEDLARQARRQAEARLVEQDQSAAPPSARARCEHLLLPAREQPGRPGARARAGSGSSRRPFPCRAPTASRSRARVGAHQQVVAHRQQREHLAPFGHVAEAAPDDRRPDPSP